MSATRKMMMDAATEHGWVAKVGPDRQVLTRGTEQVTVFYGSTGQLITVHVGTVGGPYGIVYGTLKRERTLEILRSEPADPVEAGAAVEAASKDVVLIPGHHVPGDTLPEQVAKLSRAGIYQSWNLHPGSMERRQDGTVAFEVVTANHGAVKVLVSPS